MALEEYQTPITKSILYSIDLKGGKSGVGENITPRITMIGGTATVYAADSATAPASLAEMVAIDTLVGMKSFLSIPRYLAIVEDGGTITSATLTSIEATDLGAIS